MRRHTSPAQPAASNKLRAPWKTPSVSAQPKQHHLVQRQRLPGAQPCVSCKYSLAPRISSQRCILISPSSAYVNAFGIAVVIECCASCACKTVPFWPLFGPSCFKDNNSVLERKQNWEVSKKSQPTIKKWWKSIIPLPSLTEQILKKAIQRKGRMNGHSFHVLWTTIELLLNFMHFRKVCICQDAYFFLKKNKNMKCKTCSVAKTQCDILFWRKILG